MARRPAFIPRQLDLNTKALLLAVKWFNIATRQNGKTTEG
jgi:hypothetical protein